MIFSVRCFPLYIHIRRKVPKNSQNKFPNNTGELSSLIDKIFLVSNVLFVETLIAKALSLELLYACHNTIHIVGY